MIKFRCDCGQKVSVDEKNAGRTGKCPRCGKKIFIPQLQEPPVEVIEPLGFADEPPPPPLPPPSAPPTAREEPKKPPPASKPEVYDILQGYAPTPAKEEPDTIDLVPESPEPTTRRTEAKSYELTKEPEKPPPLASYVLAEQAAPAAPPSAKPPAAPSRRPSKPPRAAKAAAAPAAAKAEEPKISAATVGVCLGCGKPVSIQAHQQFGYYCSAECREALRTKTGVAQMAAEAERAMAVTSFVRTIIVTIGCLAAVAVVGAIGFFFVRKLARPHGEPQWIYNNSGDLPVSEGAAFDGSILFALDDGTFVCLDHKSGGKLWTLPLQEKPLRRVPPASSSAGFVVATTASLHCVDQEGKEIWSQPLADPASNQTVVKCWVAGNAFALVGPTDLTQDESRQSYAELQKPNGYAGMSEDMLPGLPPRPPRDNASFLVALSADTGRELWRKDLRNAGISDLISWDNRIWFSTTRLNDAPPTLFAVDGNTGAPSVPLPLPESDGWHMAESDAGLVVAGAGMIKVIQTSGGGGRQIPVPGGGLATKVAAHGNCVVAKSTDGDVRCFNLADGAVKWTAHVGAGFFPPAISEGKVLAGGVPNGKNPPEDKDASRLPALYKQTAERMQIGRLVPKALPDLACFDLETGNSLWVAPDTGERFVSAGRYIYAIRTEERENEISRRSSYRTYLDAFDAKDGKRLWGWADMGVSRKPPVLLEDGMFIIKFNIEQWVSEGGVQAKPFDNLLIKIKIF